MITFAEDVDKFVIKKDIMDIHLQSKDIADIYSTPIFQQTSFWCDVKDRLGVPSDAFDFKVKNSELYSNVGGYSYTQGDFIILYQKLGADSCVGYIPYGPEIEPSEENQGNFLEELSESLRSYLPSDCIALRYDLNWKSHWCKEEDFDEKGVWMGAPENTYQEFQLNFKTNNWNLKKANGNILPANTIILDLSKDETTILALMKPKTRYNIHLSQRKGIEVRSLGMDQLDVWYRLYQETARRNGLYLNDLRYFQSVLAAKEDPFSGDVSVQLLVAYYEEEPLAAMFLVISSHRATYLYGASSNMHRELMPTYALQWKAIQIAKSMHCLEYDFFGISPHCDPSHPMYGLYRFKRGFGGNIFHHLGCWDYPFDDEKYKLFQALDMNRQGYRI